MVERWSKGVGDRRLPFSTSPFACSATAYEKIYGSAGRIQRNEVIFRELFAFHAGISLESKYQGTPHSSGSGYEGAVKPP